MSIADRIEKARTKLELTQAEAAAKWGINVRTLEGWESGRHKPSGFARTQLEKLLNEILGAGGRGKRA